MNKAALSVVATLLILGAGTWYVISRLNAFAPPIETAAPILATTTPETVLSTTTVEKVQ